MSRWIKGLLGILFVVGIVSVSSVPAYAVAGAGPKAVVTGKGGNPIAGARVTITRQDGSKEEKETDRAGVVVLNDPYGDSERGILPIANIGIELVDGSTYFFDGPFGNQHRFLEFQVSDAAFSQEICDYPSTICAFRHPSFQ